MFGKDKPANDSQTNESRSSSVKAPSSASNSINSRSAAMIGQSINIKGTITGKENLIVEGTVEGSISLPDNDLTVSESGKVTADLSAKSVNVGGQVTGDISGTEKVVVSKTGRVRGNIVAPRVTLEDGAKFKGSIDMDPGEASKPAGKVAGKVGLSPTESSQEAS
jgi:cytoskeletal protein CcmA (bactofilin family)